MNFNSQASKILESCVTHKYDIMVAHIANIVYWKPSSSTAQYSTMCDVNLKFDKNIDDYFDNFLLLQ